MKLDKENKGCLASQLPLQPKKEEKKRKKYFLSTVHV